MTKLEMRPGLREIQVGIGELELIGDPGAVLVARGLGSCVGLAAYDPVTRVGALLHVMLPERARRDDDDGNPYRYADSGVAAMLRSMRERGAQLNRLVLKAAGGACIVAVPGFGDRFRIGERNIQAIHDVLGRHRLRLAAEDTGGNLGRTMRLHLADGSVTVQGIGQPPRPL